MLELFTSEGCSSCPPADSLARELSMRAVGDGPQLIVLGEHVDYWNRLGWTDPYSAAAFNQRQRAYATRLGQAGVYTPQVVIDGSWEAVGSDRPRIGRLLAEASHHPKQSIGLEIKPSGGRTFSVTIHLGKSLQPKVSGPAEVILAVAEEGLRTQVPRGENAGRLLQHAPVVRSLTTLGALGSLAGSDRMSVALSLDPRWDVSRIHVVVLLQGSGNGRILGAAAGRLPAGL